MSDIYLAYGDNVLSVKEQLKMQGYEVEGDCYQNAYDAVRVLYENNLITKLERNEIIKKILASIKYHD